MSTTMPENLVIRKKIPIKLKEPKPVEPSKPSNVVIRKKIQIKLKEPVKKLQVSAIDQLNQYLDEKFLHHLMYVKNSWSEVKYKIQMDSNNQECWWDLELLLT